MEVPYTPEGEIPNYILLKIYKKQKMLAFLGHFVRMRPFPIHHYFVGFQRNARSSSTSSVSDLLRSHGELGLAGGRDRQGLVACLARPPKRSRHD